MAPTSRQSIEYTLQDDDVLVFMHIPKTAGLTFRAILENFFDRETICPEQLSQRLVKNHGDELDRYRLYRGHFPYSIKRLLKRDVVFVTFLRDPVERTISQFEYTRQQPLARFHQIIKSNDMSLVDFINHEVTIPAIQNIQTRYIATNHFRKSVGPAPLQHLGVDVAKQRLDSFAFVGLTERFQDSLFLLAYTFGWPPITQFQTHNVTAKRLRQDDLPPHVVDRIAELNALDIELYGYTQELFAERFDRMCDELIDRYDGGANTASPWPPDANTLEKLLQRHYEDRFAEAHRAVSTLRYEFDDAIWGYGWHPAELSAEHGGVRWSGPGTVSTIDLPLAATSDLAIRFRVLMALAPDIMGQLQLRVNGHPLELHAERDMEGATVFESRISQEAVQPDKALARLSFEINRTLSPNEMDPENGDTRRLGLLFNWLEVHPILD